MACIDFVNTKFTDPLRPGSSFDRLSRLEWWVWFLDRHELRVRERRPVPIRRLRAFRSGLRNVLERWATKGTLLPGDVARLDGWVRNTLLRRRVSRVGRLELTTQPVAWDWDSVIGAIAVSAVEMMSTKEHERLRTCANSLCSWMFYDQTLNASKRFCSADLCGNVVRVRRFRRKGAHK